MNSNWNDIRETPNLGQNLWPGPLTSNRGLLYGHHFCQWQNLVKIPWWYGESNIVKKIVRDGRTDERTDRSVIGAAWTQVKNGITLSIIYQLLPVHVEEIVRYLAEFPFNYPVVQGRSETKKIENSNSLIKICLIAFEARWMLSYYLRNYKRWIDTYIMAFVQIYMDQWPYLYNSDHCHQVDAVISQLLTSF